MDVAISVQLAIDDHSRPHACSGHFYSDVILRTRVSETLEALEKADSARLDGPLQRSLASTTSDGTARDAIVFDKVRAAAGWPSCRERLLPIKCLANNLSVLHRRTSSRHMGQLVMTPGAQFMTYRSFVLFRWM